MADFDPRRLWLGDVSSRIVNDLRAAPFYVVITPATSVNGIRL